MTKSKIYLGIDGGATKMMAQSIQISDQSKLASYNAFNYEISYEQMPGWNNNFQPLHISIQKELKQSKDLKISLNEKQQGKIIIDTVQTCYQQALKKNQKISGVGLCFPGLKNDDEDGTILLVNGPRIPDFVDQLKKKNIPINQIYNDSVCCLIGEIKGLSGSLRDISNGIYIGGGTGIADGLIINGKIADFNKDNNLKRSWELTLPTGNSVESSLAPKYLINTFNRMENYDPITSLEELIILAEKGNQSADRLLTQAVEAIRILVTNRVKYIGEKTNKNCQKIVIGQRLAIALSLQNGKNTFMKKIHSSLNHDIPITLSKDRRTAALGAAWKKACS